MKKKQLTKSTFLTLCISMFFMMANTSSYGQWSANGDDIYRTIGKVGIGTNTPEYFLHLSKTSATGNAKNLPWIQVDNLNTTGHSFAGFGFSGINKTVRFDMFLDGAGYFNSGTPNVYFRTNDAYPIMFGTDNTIRMKIDDIGNVIIGANGLATPAGYKLYVEDGILAEKVKVAVKSSADWSDFVFEDNYELKDLTEVESYIKANKTLPGVPSANDVVNNGIDLGSMDALLLQKIEELTLYIIQQQKEIESLKAIVNTSK